MDPAPERVPDVGHRDALHVLHEVLEVGERQAVEADHGEVVVDLAVAVDTQRKAADDVLLGRRQFILGRPGAHELGERCPRHGERLPGLAALRLHADQERALALQRRKIAVGRVGQAALLPHFLGDARHEAAAAQHVVADEQREIIGVVAAHARRADHDVRLRGVMRDRAGRARRKRRDRRQRRFRAIGPRQAARDVLGDRFRLGARQVTDQRHHGVRGGVVTPVELQQVRAGDFLHRRHFAQRAQPVRMVAEHQAVERHRRDSAGLGVGFLE